MPIRPQVSTALVRTKDRLGPWALAERCVPSGSLSLTFLRAQLGPLPLSL